MIASQRLAPHSKVANGDYVRLLDDDGKAYAQVAARKGDHAVIENLPKELKVTGLKPAVRVPSETAVAAGNASPLDMSRVSRWRVEKGDEAKARKILTAARAAHGKAK